MGEVYRARDATLKRDVALKILPDGFALDPERLARFKREAQVLASLNHSNIAAIYGFEASTTSTSSGRAVQALVLELVEGPTLADRIALGQIPVEEALPIARQIAEALEAAHEQGIVHRDLKPANVKLRPDGTVKVLDFGLAKTLEPEGTIRGDATASPTITSPAMTAIGLILGTAAYMSPEQAKGRQADKRSDVWAFGAVLYEMLSGQRAFQGDDVSDTLAAVLRQDVDLTALPASTPAPVRRLIARCLDRDVKRRLRDIGEARIVLDDPATLTSANARDADALRLPRPLWRRAIPGLLSAIAAGALAGTAAWYFKPSTPLEVTRFHYLLPEGQSLTGLASRMVDISPDGARLVYVADGRLYLRVMSEQDATAIQGTEAYQAVTSPVFSPDGRSIAFHASSDQTLKRIAATGGAAVTICPAAIPFGMSWGADGIVFSEGSKGIMHVSPNGGTPKVLVSLKDGEVSVSPQMLPGGQYLLFTVATGTAPNRWDSAHIVAQSIATGERTIIIQGGADARYLPTGHLVYAVGGSVVAVAFDVKNLEATGSPVPMVAGVARPSAGNGIANFSLSGNGTLVYIPGTTTLSAGQIAVALSDRRRILQSLKLPAGAYVAPRADPDGARIAFGTDDGTEANIHIYDLSGTTGVQRLTYGGKNRFPIWISNHRVAFQSDREGDLAIFWQSAVGGAAERLTRPEPGTSHVPESWSPKGDRFLFSVKKGSDFSLWAYSLRDKKATPFGEVHSPDPTNAVFSPDGRWVAYASTERNRPTIYVQPFPASGVQYQLPIGASGLATQPLWSPDGKELFYNPGPGRFGWVSVTTQPTLIFGNPEAVPRPFQTGPRTERRAFDITPGGKFVGLIPAGHTGSGAPIAPQLQVVLNWFEELKRLVPATK
jgi:serine/threonine protein kinase/Tol biopolymer transport system component